MRRKERSDKQGAQCGEQAAEREARSGVAGKELERWRRKGVWSKSSTRAEKGSGRRGQREDRTRGSRELRGEQGRQGEKSGQGEGDGRRRRGCD